MKNYFPHIMGILLVSVVIGTITFTLWESGAFISDRSAIINSDHVTWGGKEYSSIGGNYTEGRTIAKGQNSDWVIRMVEQDPSHTFIVVRSFLDQYLMVSDDYAVPTTGKLTTVSWNGTYITDEKFLDALTKIEAEKTTTFTYETDGIYLHTDTSQSPSFSFLLDCARASRRARRPIA